MAAEEVCPETNNVANIVQRGLSELESPGSSWHSACTATGNMDLHEIVDGDPKVQFVEWFGAIAKAHEQGDVASLKEFKKVYNKFTEAYAPLYKALLGRLYGDYFDDEAVLELTRSMSALVEGFAFQYVTGVTGDDDVSHSNELEVYDAFFKARQAMILGWLAAQQL